VKDLRHTKVTFVLRIEDLATGRPLTPDEAEVKADGGFTAPVFKQEGYFVFTDHLPQTIQISATDYRQVILKPMAPRPGEVYRLALVPAQTVQDPVYQLTLPSGEEIHIGFGNGRTGYIPAEDIPVGAEEIALRKEDTADITDMWHLLLGKEEATDPAPIYLVASKGYGKYQLLTPTSQAYNQRECRLLPLRRVVGSQQAPLPLPIPKGAGILYTMTPAGEVTKTVLPKGR